MKKDTAVVLGFTRNLAFAAASVLLDIKRLNSNLANEIVILHDGLSLNDKNILMSILPIPIRFIEYELPVIFKNKEAISTIAHFSKMVFSKFECLRLLENYKSVMWLDYDIVLLEDISELFGPSQSGIKMMPSGCPVSDQFHHPINDYNMDKEGICGSTFVFYDTLPRYMDMYHFCYDKLQSYSKNLYLGEQGIFDCMIQEFDLIVEPIDKEKYSPHPTDNYGKDTKILHAFGRPKFWNGLNNEQWNNNYKDWLNMGGAKYRNESFLKKLSKKLKSLLRPKNG